MLRLAQRSWLLALAAVTLSSPVLAGTATYEIGVDTSSIAGTSGSLDFNFNPGPFGSQLATVNVSDVMTDGVAAGTSMGIGDASGTLPGTLALSNDMPYNDVFQGFTYGKSLSFQVTLSGPALSAPDGTSLSGSSFAFSMFGDQGGTMPVLTTDSQNGFAYTIDVNLDGSTTATNYLLTTPAVPEPSSTALALIGLAFLAWRGERATASPGAKPAFH